MHILEEIKHYIPDDRACGNENRTALARRILLRMEQLAGGHKIRVCRDSVREAITHLTQMDVIQRSLDDEK